MAIDMASSGRRQGVGRTQGGRTESGRTESGQTRTKAFSQTENRKEISILGWEYKSGSTEGSHGVHERIALSLVFFSFCTSKIVDV